jgi:hypothetical protein
MRSGSAVTIPDANAFCRFPHRRRQRYDGVEVPSMPGTAAGEPIRWFDQAERVDDTLHAWLRGLAFVPVFRDFSDPFAPWQLIRRRHLAVIGCVAHVGGPPPADVV